ncbi:MAG TPA: type II toxin-antitoxin system VapB family antitoxin [Acidobacteriota bacterium]|nr:type II toxin-antitoxin system VapB family antitoxin [Acidobacteriota bacterium]
MKEAKLFKNGQSQAVRLPREFRFDGKSVYVRKLGSAVILIPKGQSWDLFLSACSKFTKDFMQERDQGIQKRESL